MHTSVLGMPVGSSTGVMITDFYDGILGRQSQVEQTMLATNSPEGLLIVGSNPVYPGIRRSYSTYSPDNFLMRVLPNGDIAAVNCDDTALSSYVGYTNLLELLAQRRSGVPHEFGKCCNSICTEVRVLIC